LTREPCTYCSYLFFFPIRFCLQLHFLWFIFISVNFKSLLFIFFQLDGTGVVSSLDAVLDTGTTYILLPRRSYQDLVSYFQKNYCNLVGVCSQVNIFNGNCLLDIAVRVSPPFPFLPISFPRKTD
jgi:hypothetical protein